MPVLNLNPVERALLSAAAAAIALTLAVAWLSAPMGAERFTQPAGQELPAPGSVDPNGPGPASWCAL